MICEIIESIRNENNNDDIDKINSYLDILLVPIEYCEIKDIDKMIDAYKNIIVLFDKFNIFNLTTIKKYEPEYKYLFLCINSIVNASFKPEYQHLNKFI